MKDYLKQFQFPEDLKEMDYDELELLSYEIRDFLIEKVSKTGGHLSSNLGAVELTIQVTAAHPFHWGWGLLLRGIFRERITR